MGKCLRYVNCVFGTFTNFENIYMCEERERKDTQKASKPNVNREECELFTFLFSIFFCCMHCFVLTITFALINTSNKGL